MKNTRTEQTYFLEGARYALQLAYNASSNLSTEQMYEMVEFTKTEAKRRYPEFDKFPEPARGLVGK